MTKKIKVESDFEVTEFESLEDLLKTGETIFCTEVDGRWALHYGNADFTKVMICVYWLTEKPNKYVRLVDGKACFSDKDEPGCVPIIFLKSSSLFTRGLKNAGYPIP